MEGAKEHLGLMLLCLGRGGALRIILSFSSNPN